MSQISFYVLSASGEVARQQFACRLAEKAYRMEKRVHIQAASREAANKLDNLMWTFRQGSFVPHEILKDADTPPLSPVTIGFAATVQEGCDLYINLVDEIPESVSSFPRIAEIVTTDEEVKLQSRSRFAHYRSDGHTLETHTL